MAHSKMQKPEPNSNDEKPPKVTGIGGIFFFSNDPEKTKKWYYYT